jgi:hypothetical protein
MENQPMRDLLSRIRFRRKLRPRQVNWGYHLRRRGEHRRD